MATSLRTTPLHYLFERFLRHLEELFKANIDEEVKVFGEFKILMLVELLILVLIVVPQSRKITKNSGGSGKATGTFAISARPLQGCAYGWGARGWRLLPWWNGGPRLHVGQ